MGALVGFVSEDTQNFLFLLTYTQKKRNCIWQKGIKIGYSDWLSWVLSIFLFASCLFSPMGRTQRTARSLLVRARQEFTKEEGQKIGEGVELSVESNVFYNLALCRIGCRHIYLLSRGCGAKGWHHHWLWPQRESKEWASLTKKSISSEGLSLL